LSDTTLSSERTLSISVAYGDVRVDFSGPPDLVMRSLHEFVSKEIPNMDLAKSISANYSLNDLVQMFRDLIRITPEGPRVWVQDKKLSDRDVIMLQLVAARAHSLTANGAQDALSVSEIEAATGLYPKTISSRLSELTKQAHVERSEGDGGGRYRITTTGINRLHEQLSKKFKTA
jgi:DNA-binding transcriptional ArsR family regulator